MRTGSHCLYQAGALSYLPPKPSKDAVRLKMTVETERLRGLVRTNFGFSGLRVPNGSNLHRIELVWGLVESSVVRRGSKTTKTGNFCEELQLGF